MKKLSGSCLCGKVKVEVADDFAFLGNCHCSQCRKFTGSDYSSVGGVTPDKFKIIAGEKYITLYPKTTETELGFCSCCGSSLFSHKLKTGMYNIRLGILDEAPTEHPSFHIFVDSKAPWHEITDSLKQFKEGPK